MVQQLTKAGNIRSRCLRQNIHTIASKFAVPVRSEAYATQLSGAQPMTQGALQVMSPAQLHCSKHSGYLVTGILNTITVWPQRIWLCSNVRGSGHKACPPLCPDSPDRQVLPQKDFWAVTRLLGIA